MTKILFIFHEANRTGATLNLFNMVKWLSENSDISMSFLFKENGNLVNDLSKVGVVYLWNPDPVQTDQSLLKKVVNYIKKRNNRKSLFKQLIKCNFKLIYANTLTSSDIIKDLAPLKCKILWHIHELDLAINILGQNLLDASSYISLFIANSNSTKVNLKKHGIDGTKIKVLNPIINYNKIQSLGFEPGFKQTLRIPDDAFIIGSSGSGTERKGISTFIQLPVIVDYLFPENKFYYMWIGKIFNSKIIEHDIETLGMKNRILLPGEQKNPLPFYRIFDIYISCSKEESFGISAIEAAVMGKPLICFEKTGGLEEIVNQAGNITVPYMNIIVMARKIIELYFDRDKLANLGMKASKYAKKFDEELIMPEFKKILVNITL